MSSFLLHSDAHHLHLLSFPTRRSSDLDLFKMMFKEVVIPTNSNRFLFVIAPIVSLVPAFATWAVVPLSDNFVIADIDAGLLYVLALTSLGVYGVILAGWASNSKYRSEEHTSELQSRENI